MTPLPLRLADRMIRAHRWDAVIEILDASGLPSDPAIERRRRMALAMSGRLGEAAAAGERVTAHPGSDAADWQHLAHIRMRLLRTEAAFAAAAEAIRRDPRPARPYAVAFAAAAFEPRLAEGLAALLLPEATAGVGTETGERPSVAVPWRLPPYLSFGGAHPVIASALGAGSRLEARWAAPDTPMEPGRALALLPGLTDWARSIDPVLRPALADFLVHRLPFAFHRLPGADAVFFHTIAAPFGERNWVLHLEHLNLLFAPMVTYPTAVIRTGDPQVELLRGLLESPRCLGVFTHVRETRERLGRLYGEAVRTKTAYIRLGIDPDRPRTPPPAPAVLRRATTLLFTNSLVRDNFHMRGGPDAVQAVIALRRRHGDVRLLLRSALPAEEDAPTRRALRHPAVTWLSERMSEAEIDALYAEADVFLLPSALLHAVSIVRALRAGLALVTSDVYGVAEYVRHGINGLIVPGRRALITPRIENAVYAEDCRPALVPSMVPPDPVFQRRLIATLTQLAENPRLTERLRRTARTLAARDHRGDRWAAGVSAFLIKRLITAPTPFQGT